MACEGRLLSFSLFPLHLVSSEDKMWASVDILLRWHIVRDGRWWRPSTYGIALLKVFDNHWFFLGPVDLFLETGSFTVYLHLRNVTDSFTK